MIISNNSPPSPVKTTNSFPTLPSPRTTQGDTPPPAYGSSSRSGEQPLIERQKAEPAGGRFFRALAVAVLIYLATATLLGGMVGSINRKHFQWGPPAGPDDNDGTPLACHLPWEGASHEHNFQGDPISDFTTESFAGTIFPTYSSRTTAELPTDAPLLFLEARGSLAYGKTRFETYEPEQGVRTPKVKVTIDVRYWSLQARDRANICILQKEEGGMGVGIFTPQRWPHVFEETDKLQFLVTVSFPASRESPLSLQTVTTKLPLFSHEVGDLDGYVDFRALRLHASNAFIKSKSARATHIHISTSNGPVTGTFNATDSLTIITSNGPIDATIDLENEDHHEPTELTLKTSNGRISAAISLFSTKNYHLLSTGGFFKVNAQTSNGRLALGFPAIPSASHLKLDATTSNAASEVTLHPAFEGSFSLTTTNGPVIVDDNRDTTDPTGHGLRRTVELERIVRGVVEGKVWWGNARDHRELGLLQIRTTNARSTLTLM